MTADQLRECPFCNGDGELDIDENHNHFVSCIECRAEGSRAACASDAANAWNTRPTAVASHAEGEVALSYIIGQMRIQADHDFKNGLESASTRVGHWADELDRIRTLDPRWHIAGQVREKLDQACCPDHWMRVAVETITAMTIHCPTRSGDEVRDAARYRWLLANRFYFADNPHTQHYHKAGIDTGWMIVQDMSRAGLSSAIDAAKAARGEGQP